MSTGERKIAAFADLVDLVAARMGGRVLAASDDFFAEKGNLITEAPAVFDPHAYTERGKWMDGWESRRRRTPGHDWCILRLGVAGSLRAVDIDTHHFLGNHAPYASLDACRAPEDATAEQLVEEAEWVEIVPQVPLQPGSRNLFSTRADGPWTHLRLHIYPDGGVARLRAYGEPQPQVTAGGGEVDLASARHGGRAIAASDVFFSPMVNVTLPQEPRHMGEGWETRRRRDGGRDWIVVQLGAVGALRRIEIDTKHFKGNYPDRCRVSGICWPDAPPKALISSPDWEEVVPSSRMGPDQVHVFEDLEGTGPFTHLRLEVVPCGGVARLRAHGVARQPEPEPVLTWLNGLKEDESVDVFLRCCGSHRWAKAMSASRPFASRAHLQGRAEQMWWRLSERDWQEAFSHHPAIGEDVERLRARFASTAEWSSGEQAGVQSASEDTLQALAQGNRDYHVRFGYLFIVCATGRSADEMLAILRERLQNDPQNEIRIAAGEQAKITRIRLDKLEAP